MEKLKTKDVCFKAIRCCSAYLKASNSLNLVRSYLIKTLKLSKRAQVLRAFLHTRSTERLLIIFT